MFHSDKKTSAQAAYFVGTDGTEGRRIARRTEPEPEAGEPQVSREHTDWVLSGRPYRQRWASLAQQSWSRKVNLFEIVN